MATKQITQTVGELLVTRRGDGYKSEAARAIGVSRQIYDAWETGHFIPGDEWAKKLAAYLDISLEEVVLRLYNDRERRRDPGAPIIHELSKPDWAGRPMEFYARRVSLVAA